MGLVPSHAVLIMPFQSLLIASSRPPLAPHHLLALLLQYFAESGKSFIMEVATRTAADKKGGHLAIRTADGRMLLRESAQCAEADEAEFQNTDKHQ